VGSIFNARRAPVMRKGIKVRGVIGPSWLGLDRMGNCKRRWCAVCSGGGGGREDSIGEG
jgi:hypothetical protein